MSEQGFTSRPVWCQNWDPASIARWPSPVAKDTKVWRGGRSPGPCHWDLKKAQMWLFLFCFFLLGWLRPPLLAPAHQHLLRTAPGCALPAWPGDDPQQHQEVSGRPDPAEVLGCRERQHTGLGPLPLRLSRFGFLSHLTSFGSFLSYTLKNQCSWVVLCLCC